MMNMAESSVHLHVGMPLQSAEKRHFDTITGNPPSPLTLKRRQTDAHLSTAAPLNSLQDTDRPQVPVLYAFEDTSNLSGAIVPYRLSDETRMELSLAVMEQETHAGRLAIQQEVRSGKGTDPAYLRHLRNYEKFTEIDQAHRLSKDPTWKVLSPHPITVVKAATFLEYETKRPKVSSVPHHLQVLNMVADIHSVVHLIVYI